MIYKIVGLIIWILLIIFTVRRAGILGRDRFLWGVLAVFFPVIALIILLFLGPKRR